MNRRSSVGRAKARRVVSLDFGVFTIIVICQFAEFEIFNFEAILSSGSEECPRMETAETENVNLFFRFLCARTNGYNCQCNRCFCALSPLFFCRTTAEEMVDLVVTLFC